MYCVYIIKSKIKNWYYVGLTSNLDNRINDHNIGKEQTTKPYKPYDIIFVQEFDSRLQARDLEKFLKVRFNKEALLQIIA